MGVRQPPARKLRSLKAARALRALEVLVFHPAAPPAVAETMGIHVRTARNLLYTLEDEGYLQRGNGTGRQRYVFSLTPRLLALAGQLAARLPLVTTGERVVRDLHQHTCLDAYLVIPSYGDVLVLASAGDGAPAPWSLLPATDSAGGSVLLAYRESWRDNQRPDDESSTGPALEATATEVRDRGYALGEHGGTQSLAVAVPMVPLPLAALILAGPTTALDGDQREALLAVLHRAAARLGDSYHWRPRSPTARDRPSTLRITAKDIDAGCIRVPNAAKRLFPVDTADTTIRLRGTTVRARWNPRRGLPEYSGTLHVRRRMLQRLIDANETLAVTVASDGRIELH